MRWELCASECVCVCDCELCTAFQHSVSIQQGVMLLQRGQERTDCARVECVFTLYAQQCQFVLFERLDLSSLNVFEVFIKTTHELIHTFDYWFSVQWAMSVLFPFEYAVAHHRSLCYTWLSYTSIPCRSNANRRLLYLCFKSEHILKGIWSCWSVYVP